MYAYIYYSMHAYIHTYTLTHIHAFIRACMRTTHTHTHTLTLTQADQEESSNSGRQLHTERQLSTGTFIWGENPLYGETATARDNYQPIPLYGKKNPYMGKKQ